MVYFPDSDNPATADTTTAAAVWIERIDSEYREMPGLRLTLAQAARLTSPRRLIVIEDTDAEAEVAIGRAADRAARVVARAVQTLTDWRPLE